jgi:hypothetical protein
MDKFYSLDSANLSISIQTFPIALQYCNSPIRFILSLTIQVIAADNTNALSASKISVIAAISCNVDIVKVRPWFTWSLAHR